MAGHLVAKGGHEVTVFNRTPAKAKAWAEKFGGRTAATPKAAAEGQDFVMACVGNDNDLRAITIGADGAFAPRPRPKSPANSTRPRPKAASNSSTRRCPAARPARRTAF
jgi:3-hydroxyisobutyrate dehydrogenase-like beta-hydroxyacid dehydrogenase